MYKNFLTDLQFFSAQAPCIQQLLCSHSFPENVLGAGDLTMKKQIILPLYNCYFTVGKQNKTSKKCMFLFIEFTGMTLVHTIM